MSPYEGGGFGFYEVNMASRLRRAAEVRGRRPAPREAMRRWCSR